MRSVSPSTWVDDGGRRPLRPAHRGGAGLRGGDEPPTGFGEDLMSRVSYVMMNPGAEDDMTAAIRGCIDTMVADLCSDAGADPTTSSR